MEQRDEVDRIPRIPKKVTAKKVPRQRGGMVRSNGRSSPTSKRPHSNESTPGRKSPTLEDRRILSVPPMVEYPLMDINQPIVPGLVPYRRHTRGFSLEGEEIEYENNAFSNTESNGSLQIESPIDSQAAQAQAQAPPCLAGTLLDYYSKQPNNQLGNTLFCEIAKADPIHDNICKSGEYTKVVSQGNPDGSNCTGTIQTEDQLLQFVCPAFPRSIRESLPTAIGSNDSITLPLSTIQGEPPNTYTFHRICISEEGASEEGASEEGASGNQRQSISFHTLDAFIKEKLSERDYSVLYDAVNFSLDSMYETTVNETDPTKQMEERKIHFLYPREIFYDPAFKPNPFLKTRFGTFGDLTILPILESSNSIPVTYKPFQLKKDPHSLFYSKFNISMTPPTYTNRVASVTATFQDPSTNQVIYTASDLDVTAEKAAQFVRAFSNNPVKSSAAAKSKMLGDQGEALVAFQCMDRVWEGMDDKAPLCVPIVFTLDRPLVALLLTLGSVCLYTIHVNNKAYGILGIPSSFQGAQDPFYTEKQILSYIEANRSNLEDFSTVQSKAAIYIEKRNAQLKGYKEAAEGDVKKGSGSFLSVFQALFKYVRFRNLFPEPPPLPEEGAGAGAGTEPEETLDILLSKNALEEEDRASIQRLQSLLRVSMFLTSHPIPVPHSSAAVDDGMDPTIQASMEDCATFLDGVRRGRSTLEDYRNSYPFFIGLRDLYTSGDAFVQGRLQGMIDSSGSGSGSGSASSSLAVESRWNQFREILVKITARSYITKGEEREFKDKEEATLVKQAGLVQKARKINRNARLSTVEKKQQGGRGKHISRSNTKRKERRIESSKKDRCAPRMTRRKGRIQSGGAGAGDNPYETSFLLLHIQDLWNTIPSPSEMEEDTLRTIKYHPNHSISLFYLLLLSVVEAFYEFPATPEGDSISPMQLDLLFWIRFLEGYLKEVIRSKKVDHEILYRKFQALVQLSESHRKEEQKGFGTPIECLGHHFGIYPTADPSMEGQLDFEKEGLIEFYKSIVYPRAAEGTVWESELRTTGSMEKFDSAIDSALDSIETEIDTIQTEFYSQWIHDRKAKEEEARETTFLAKQKVQAEEEAREPGTYEGDSSELPGSQIPASQLSLVTGDKENMSFDSPRAAPSSPSRLGTTAASLLSPPPKNVKSSKKYYETPVGQTSEETRNTPPTVKKHAGNGTRRRSSTMMRINFRMGSNNRAV